MSNEFYSIQVELSSKINHEASLTLSEANSTVEKESKK